MADRKICDNCGKLPAWTHRYFIERENDGNEISNRYGHIDLCHEHAMALQRDLDRLITNSSGLKVANLDALKVNLIEQMRRIR